MKKDVEFPFEVNNSSGNASQNSLPRLCYGFVTGDDGKIYGVVSDTTTPFELVSIDHLRPVRVPRLLG